MLFYSFTYLLIFLPTTLLLYFGLRYLKFNSFHFLILASIFFYSWWNIYYLPIILFSIITNFYFSKILKKENLHKKKYLILSIIVNILLLAIFKYLDFLIENYNLIFNTQIEPLNLPFPLAISFFTFQSIAFLVNVYDNEIKEIKFKKFFLFVIFFPQLIAGPIVKYNYMIPQLSNIVNLRFNNKNFIIGLTILLIGLFKKVYLAESLSLFVENNYSDLENLNILSSWVTSICFTFQFYFDFSGYVDMATGSALMMNIVLPANFNSPLKATSIINFWQKWHITLSNFLTNYIYMPIMKTFKEFAFYKSLIAILIVFFIAGLWHGPSWNFVVFGLFHGFGLVINHVFRTFNIKLWKLISWFLTFNFVNISFIFFKLENVNQSIIILKKMFFFEKNEFDYQANYLTIFNNDYNLLITLCVSIIICFCFKNSYSLIEKLSIR